MNLILLILGVIGLLLVFAFWVWPKIKGTSAAAALPDSIESFLNRLSSTTVKTADVAGVVSSYLSLTAIRKLDCVQEDPKALEATDYLRGVITAWKRPVEPDVIVAPAPTVESLAAELAVLKSKVVGQTVSEIPPASRGA